MISNSLYRRYVIMIEVDIFWSFALGAMFAAAAGRQIKNLKDEDGYESLVSNKYFVAVLIYCALFFNPSGVYLLHAFPHWESMQVFWVHALGHRKGLGQYCQLSIVQK